MKRPGFIITLCAAVVLLSVSCKNPSSKEPIKLTDLFFDTVINIKIWGTGDERILINCKKICERYEGMFSRTVKDSDVSRINASNGKPVLVSKETIEVINKGLYFCGISGGLFDITIAPLTELWDIKNNPGVIPSKEDIAEAKSHVNYKNVVVKDNTVMLKDPLAGIDLGALAKGYVADKLKEYLKSEGVRHALIDLGGNILTLGGRADGKNFKIGIQKPFAPGNEVLTTIDVYEKSVVSSGVYERYFEKDGKYYHHILNPVTGFPFENGLLQVTIVSDSSADGDGLSTTCFAMGLEKGTKLIESLEKEEAFFVTKDFKIEHVVAQKTPLCYDDGRRAE